MLVSFGQWHEALSGILAELPVTRNLFIRFLFAILFNAVLYDTMRAHESFAF